MGYSTVFAFLRPDLDHYQSRHMDKETKQKTIREFALHEGDVGSSEVQIAVLTGRIQELTEHLKVHQQDHSTRRSLIAKVNRRRRLLNYLRSHNHDNYMDMVKRLKLRH